MSRPLYATHEWVSGASCPACGAKETGTIWEGEDRAFPEGICTYRVEPGGRMGNKSYRDDSQVGRWCVCGWEGK